ncbi:ABC transporter ATP-binding protein [Streptomyces sp. NPDC051018]|uniref:ABC transporter ATP-binding protein n=1 Tax=Streptomyces sp. NPDC051018 TaxID=3365639 RepID=UPI0037A50813
MTDAAPPPVMEFRSVGMCYSGRPRVVALDTCDLRIGRGEYVTMVGPSGSGKSTFLNIAGLLDTPTSGRYLLDGIDTGTVTRRQRAALRGTRIGFVFQAFHLLAHRTALENVELAMVYQGVPRRERRVRAEEALHRVGLGHRGDFLPTRLSGGERQRVAIARAVVTRPSLLLCDEPTGNLDSGTTTSVLGLLSELHDAGMTLVVVTHDARVAAQGRRTLTMLDGSLRDLSPMGTAR